MKEVLDWGGGEEGARGERVVVRDGGSDGGGGCGGGVGEEELGLPRRRAGLT